MRKYNSIIIIATIGIVLVLSFMFLTTYAYFTVNVEGRGSVIRTSSYDMDLEISFSDTSTIALVNAYTGDSIVKNFTVTNTGDAAVYYDIVFSELVNDFSNPKDLVYTLSSTNNGANKEQTVIPTENNSKLASYIKINTDEVQTYTLTITFLKTDANQINNMNKTFSSKISLESSDNIERNDIFKDNSLIYNIINNNTINSDIDIDFNNLPVSNGLYKTNNTINGATVYYYRGDTTLNNNVLFAGYCWKIIRTTEDLGVRMIYNGLPTENTCVNTTSATTNIASEEFNVNDNYNAYVGFKYGSPNTSSYLQEHSSVNNSNIKNTLDTWYSTNLNNYSSYISDSNYCINRDINVFTENAISFTNYGYSSYNTGYNSYYRLKSLANTTPSLDCYYKKDILSVSSTIGNSSLTNPVGLITADELVFAGYTSTIANTTNYLYNNNAYWTMTPAYFNNNKAYNYYVNEGLLSEDVVSVAHNVRPVITLKKNTVLLNGNGSSSTPYKITN